MATAKKKFFAAFPTLPECGRKKFSELIRF